MVASLLLRGSPPACSPRLRFAAEITLAAFTGDLNLQSYGNKYHLSATKNLLSMIKRPTRLIIVLAPWDVEYLVPPAPDIPLDCWGATRARHCRAGTCGVACEGLQGSSGEGRHCRDSAAGLLLLPPFCWRCEAACPDAFLGSLGSLFQRDILFAVLPARDEDWRM